LGHVYIEVEFQGLTATRAFKTLVDTGATYTVIPLDLAKELGVVETPYIENVVLANRQTVEARVAMTRVRILDRAFTVRVLVMDAAEPLIGVDTLETLGLKVDPVTGAVEPSRGFVARI